MSERLRGIRGATTLDADTRAQLDERVSELVEAMLELNGVERDDLVSIVFTSTSDIRSGFPATSARLVGLADTPVIGMQEIDVPGGLALAVRILMHVYTDRPKAEIKHVYLRGADVLRPDLTAS